MDEITVVGGGLAGLIAAIECAERGAPNVRLLEARRRLGGRAASTPEPFVANLGPHALYAGGSLWDWLCERELERPYRRPASPAIRFRWDREIRRTPPLTAIKALKALRGDAPVDRDLRSWVAEQAGDEAAAAISGLAGVLTFDADPGRLSAAFVVERIRRILLPFPPVARYVVGGWGALVGRLADRARALGVRIERGALVADLTEVTRRGPVILAVEPGAARRLLGDDAPAPPESPRVALLDVGLAARRGDPYLVLDLDEAAFVDRFTAVDGTLAPRGHGLVQACVGLRPDESLDEGEVRLERLFDQALVGWRERVVWRRRGVVHEATGALDMPGRTWRDRTPVAFADGVFLAGDWVAAPGHLSEVSCASAVAAADYACTATLRLPASSTA